MSLRKKNGNLPLSFSSPTPYAPLLPPLPSSLLLLFWSHLTLWDITDRQKTLCGRDLSCHQSWVSDAGVWADFSGEEMMLPDLGFRSSKQQCSSVPPRVLFIRYTWLLRKTNLKSTLFRKERYCFSRLNHFKWSSEGSTHATLLLLELL
jgi:hypothetical protein